MYLSQSCESEVLHFCNQNLKQNSSVLLCVSGGADSVSMLYLLYELMPKLPLKKIAVAHVNHALRGEESDEDEKLVEAFSNNLRLEFFNKRLSKRTPKSGGIEEWARNERYKFFHQVKKKHCFDYIATAHTKDDQAETVLMRLMRGAGIRGLRGILPAREDGVIRPLLSLQREELLKWLNERNIRYRNDSSNEDQNFKRNWIRHTILPAIKLGEPDVVNNLSCFARQMNKLNEQTEAQVNIWIRSNVIDCNPDLVRVKREGFTDTALASSAVIELFRRNGITVLRDHIQRVVDAALTVNKTKFLLPSGWCCMNRKNQLLIYRVNAPRVSFNYLLDYPGEIICEEIAARFLVSGYQKNNGIMPRDNKTVWLNVERNELPLSFRAVNDEDEFWPLGAKGSMNLKQFLSAQGVSRWEYEHMGVVVSAQGEVVWVPGMRISHKFRVTEGCRRVFIISFQPHK
ncbi:tRNA(Ile)-lysidine synthetase [Chitinispirillum alkaliphilum]|nr:tRNA(Ile)-lysidine synthetase [Chitinispirillum alkaliphilum]